MIEQDFPQYPLISVIIPVYNAGSTIQKFIDSLIGNDYPSLEVIFVDDSSDDDSGEIINKFNYKLLRNERRMGQSISRNKGVAEARGELICFFDSDVILKPDTISALYKTLLEHNCDAVSGNYDAEPADDNFFSAYYAFLKSVGHGNTIVRDHTILGTYCCIVKKTYYEAVGGFRNFPPGVDIECEDIGERLHKGGCVFVFNPNIRVKHHFGGFKKMLYIFGKRTYWFVRYKLRRKGTEEKLPMRGPEFGLAVIGAGLTVALFSAFIIGIIYKGGAGSISIVFILSAALSGMAVVVFLRQFILFGFRKRGIIFALKSIVSTFLFFSIADIAIMTAIIVHLFKSLSKTQDILTE